VNIIEVNNLTKLYGSFTAVDRVNFSIKAGEIFGFLGPNGAGKTTTINMLTGLAKVTAGSVNLAGIDCIKNIKKAQQKMGVVPDESNLYPELNGFENLCFCASLYGMEKHVRERKARLLLEQFGLADAAKKLFKAYSRGMKRKLTIAAGVIHDPEILFLDEPTTGIDVESARQIRKLIVDLNKSGTTVFLTTHYIEEAERLCDRIAFIVKGKIVRIGSIEELMEEAQKENTVQFSLEKDALNTLSIVQQRFPDFRIKVLDNRTFRVYSPVSVDLMPFMQFFADNEVKVYEAKIIRPSLEEVFVKITGIEAANMKKEKEGGKK